VDEEPERAAAVGVNQVEKLGAFFVILPGAFGLKAKKLAHAECGFATAEIFGLTL